MVTVRFSEKAIMDLVLSVLEAYCVYHPCEDARRRALETNGWLWGYRLELEDGHRLYQVELATVDTSALRERDAVSPRLEALRFKSAIFRSWWPHLQFLGGFHSHPFGHYQEVLRDEGWELSKGDQKWIQEAAKKVKAWGLSYDIELVVAVACLMQRSNNLNDYFRGREDVFVADFGNIRLYFGVHYLGEDEELRFDAPCLKGIYFEHEEFVRVICDENKAPKPDF